MKSGEEGPVDLVDLSLLLLYYYPHYSGSGFLSLIIHTCIRLSWSLGSENILGWRDGLVGAWMEITHIRCSHVRCSLL